MKALNEDASHDAAGSASILRIAGSAVAGIIVVGIVNALVDIPLVMLLVTFGLPPAPSVSLGFLVLGLSFLLAGVVVQCTAGPRVQAAIPSVAFAIAFTAVVWLVPAHWIYEADRGWIPAPVASFPPTGWQGWNALGMVLMAALGSILALLGNKWALRRFRAK